ncbi:SpaA isopeptide-forming pilin-related protein [Microbacterium gorillae]|uniref:SpaA isopeptide-forming pilin-related protein n=1 Tax=Microbacterium gorillae TaxID=1231063 RepID=UPI003D978315
MSTASGVSAVTLPVASPSLSSSTVSESPESSTSTDTAAAEDATAPVATASESPASTETEPSTPVSTEASASTDPESSAPTEPEAPAPADTEAPAPADTEAPAPAVTEAPAPADTEAPAPADTEAPAPADTESSAPSEPSAPASESPAKNAAKTETDLVAPLALGPLAVCGADYAYILQSNGTVSQYSPTGSPTVTTFGSWNTSGTANGLSISADGSTMYAFVQGSGTNAGGVASILRYSADTGTWETIAGSAYARASSTPLISGAINPVNGRYVLGGYSGSTYQLYEYDPVANTFRTLGSFAAVGTFGDMVFDGAGNLLVAGMTSSNFRWYTVPASVVAAGNATSTNVSVFTQRTFNPSAGSPNGIGFHSDGTMYVTNSSGLLTTYDPASGSRPGPQVTIDTAATDMATCDAPVTMTLQKSITSRFSSGDQFTVSLRTSGAVVLSTSSATTGSTTGLQSIQAGPIPVVRSQVYQVMETASSGSLSNYATNYSCTTGGAAFANGTTAPGNVTIPATGGAVSCLYTNTPLTASVKVHKTVTDFSGQNPLPGTGWTLGASFAASSGSVTLTPAATPTQVSNASGDATWAVRFSTGTARVTATVSETQRAGYVFASGSCVVTSANGATRTVALPNAQGAAVPGIAPGDAVTCNIVNKPVSATCDASAIYGLDRSSPATIWSIDPATGQMLPVVTTSGITTQVNALAVGAGFHEFWFAEQVSIGSPQSTAKVYHVKDGVTTLAGTMTGLPLPYNGAPIMGAFNPTTGIYYFGLFPNSDVPYVRDPTLHIYGFDTIANQPLGLVGTAELPDGSYNGDFSFDSAGRLLVVTDGALVAITDPIPTTASATPPVLQTRVISELSNSNAPNAVAFGPDGYLYVGSAPSSSAEQLVKYNPSSGAPATTGTALSPTNTVRDFASCALPQTLRLQKNLPDGRIAASDQFALAITGGGLSVGNTGLTAGTEIGIQNQTASEIAGPVVGLPNTTYTITETASGTTNLGSYSSSWVCVDERTGTQLASGTGSTGQFTSPAASPNGADVLCTFTNRPPAPEIELIKVDAASSSTTLAGAKFQLWKDVNGNGTLEPGTDTMVGGEQTTSSTGVILWTTGLTPGNYLLQETAAPAGYDIVAPAVHPVTLTNTRVTVTITNAKQLGTVTWSKTDASGTALAGSEWSLEGPTGSSSVTTTVVDCVGANAAACASATDKDQRAGFFSVSGLAWGDYVLRETKAPAGFVLDSTPHVFSIGATAPAQIQVGLGAYVNQQQPPLTIPLTGGLGADGFLLGGGGALFALLAVALLRHRRGQRLLRTSDL